MDSFEALPSIFGIVIDVLLAVASPIGIFLYSKFGKNVLNDRGFHCGDQSLMYPYRSSTVSSVVNAIIGVGLPTLMVLLNEMWPLRRAIRASEDRKTHLKHIAVQLYLILLPFYAGCGVQHIFTDIAKYQIGRLRPHFFDVCKPTFEWNGTVVSCEDAGVPRSLYIPEFNCTNMNFSASRQKEARISFPSGHSSFATFAMTYAFLYAQFRLPKRIGGVLPRPFLQLGFLWWAWYVVLSRHQDNKHHVTDLIGGIIIGVVVSLFFAFGVVRLQTRPLPPSPQAKDSESVRFNKPKNFDSATPEL